MSSAIPAPAKASHANETDIGDFSSQFINEQQKSLHIAPMMDITYREFRYFMRLLTKHTTLWTEMVVEQTVVHTNDLHHHLGFHAQEHPLVCQLGGNNPQKAYQAAKIVIDDWKYDAIDLNCACPSRKVCGDQAFGAALMIQQQQAVDMIKSIQDAVADSGRHIPVSIKTRIGVDSQDDLNFLVEFIRRLQPHCKRFFIHARKVHTKGLNPIQNRTIPPLNYPRVYAICRHFPDCDFYINGGIQTLQDAYNLCYGTNDDDTDTDHTEIPCSICQHANGSCTAPPSRETVPFNLRGAMLGRAANENPCMFADADRFYFGAATNPCRNRRQLLSEYAAYLEQVYPRRCCDTDDARITKRMAPPAVNVTGNDKDGDMLQIQPQYCHICRQVYEDDDDGCCNGSLSYWKDQDGRCGVLIGPTFPDEELIDIAPPKAKIAGQIMDRSFKPVMGVFFGKRGCSQFRRKLEALSRDLWIRNCGPGAVLRMAMNTVDSDLLDQEFARTNEEVYVHEHR